MINFEAFLRWAEDRFGNIIVKGTEVKMNSIFTEDAKHHLWCSPSGGRHHRDDGCYRCFYTDKKGTLVGLVMLVDNCSYEEAKEILSGENSVVDLEQKLEDFFKEKELEKESKPELKIKLPEEARLITGLPESDYYRNKAETYLKKRKISLNDLYVCTNGTYKNRILIPYYDKSGYLVYFNCRNLSEKGLRYLGPDKKIGVGKSDVIFAKSWPDKGDKIYLTEGEFDAIVLCMCGLNGMACGGKYLSDEQINLIKDYKICLALDEDKSGLGGIIEMGKKLMSAGIENITFVRPPKDIKDWNKLLIKFNLDIVKAWIEKNEKKFDEWSGEFLNLINL